MTCSKEQRKRLMTYSKTLSQEAAAAKAGLSLRTARAYLKTGGQQLQKKEWKYRQTRKDIFENVMPQIENMLGINPGLQAQTLMQWLIDQYPDQFNWSQRRTLERRVSKWRALKGPDQDVIFPQRHIPGKQSQSDWTHCSELRITIDGQPFPHMLFHFMLQYSRWETAYISYSESFDSLTMGYSKAVAELGAVAKEHRTDNLTAAVKNHGNLHVFNERWSAFMEHYGVQPSKNNAGVSHENGSIEKSHDLLKNALDQALMLRGSRNFASVSDYETFVRKILGQRNAGRKQRVAEEMPLLKALPLHDWNDPREVWPTVTSFSTVSLAKAVYSVPSRLIGHDLKALIYPEVVLLYFGNEVVQEMPRLPPGAKRINYKHIVAHLLRKPGAFANYQYRDEMFPSLVFRQAYDALEKMSPEKRDKEYLSVLNLAAMTSEHDVEAAVKSLLDAVEAPLFSTIRKMVVPKRLDEVPAIFIPAPDLCSYDLLLTHLTSAPKEIHQ